MIDVSEVRIVENVRDKHRFIPTEVIHRTDSLLKGKEATAPADSCSGDTFRARNRTQ